VLCPQHCNKFNSLLSEERRVLQLKGKACFSCCICCVFWHRTPWAPAKGPPRLSHHVLAKEVKAGPGRTMVQSPPYKYTPVVHRMSKESSTKVTTNAAVSSLCLLFRLGRLLRHRGKVRTRYHPTRYRPGWKICVTWLIQSSCPSPHCSLLLFCLENLIMKLKVVLTKAVTGQNTGEEILKSLADDKENRASRLRPN